MATLKRALGLWLLVGYGLGVTIGAGIYVLVCSVAQVAGTTAPLSFAIAGGVAALIGLCYAELGTRLPEATGTPAYVQQAFGAGWLSRLAGWAVAAVLALSAASIARGSAGYIRELIDLPVPAIAGAVVALGAAIACLGVRQSVGFAALMTVIEVGGLALVVAVGASGGADDWQRLPGLFIPVDAARWSATASGAFLAFFAFIGFENLANMAEETRAPERTLPGAILLSLGFSTAIYVTVSATAILTVAPIRLVSSDVPLLEVVRQTPWFSPTLFVAIALIAISNGVLLELMALGRLLFGMARRGWLPRELCAISQGAQVPYVATLIGAAIVLILAVAVPFVSLAGLTSAATLLIFTSVAAALWRLQATAPRKTGFRVPRIVPPIALASCLLLAAASVFM